MEALAGLLFMYSVGITIAFFFMRRSRNRYAAKSEFLTRRIKEILDGKKETQTRSENTREMPAPNPLSAPSAAPVKAPAEPSVTSRPRPQHKAKKVSAIGVSFMVGVLLLVISAAVFISATWYSLLPGAKCIVLLLVIAIVYGLAAFSKKKLDLSKTCSGLYTLASLLIPMAIIVGFFSFGLENEVLIMLLFGAISLVATGYIGFKIFGSAFHMSLGYFGFVWSIIFIFMKLIDPLTGFALGLCMAALITGILYFIFPKLAFFDKFAEISFYAAAVSFICSFFLDDAYRIQALLSQLAYFASGMLLIRKRDILRYFTPFIALAALVYSGSWYGASAGNVYAVVFPAASVLLFFLFRLTKTESFASNAALAVGIPVSMMSLFALAAGNDPSPLYYVLYILPLILESYVLIKSKNSIERAVYSYYLAITCLLMCGKVFPDPIAIYLMLAVTVVMIFMTLKKKFGHLSLAFALAFIIKLGIMLAEDMNGLIGGSVPATLEGVMVTALAAYILLSKKFGSAKSDFEELSARLSLYFCAGLPGLLFMADILSDDAVVLKLVVFFVINLIFTVLTLTDKDNYFSVIPSALVVFTVMVKALQNDADNLLLAFVLIAGLVVLGRIFYSERIIGKGRIDYLTFFAFFMCFLPADSASKIFMLAGFYSLTFIGRFGSEGDDLRGKLLKNLRMILSVTIFLAAMTFIVMDVDFTSLLNVEIRLMILLAAAVLIRFLVWPCKISQMIFFVVICLCLEIEAVNSLVSDSAMALTIVTLASLAVFIYSFIVRKRRWFILSIVMISEIGVFFALKFWEDKLWWIYLLGMGAILIVTASVNEFSRRKRVERGQARSGIFSDWTW